MAAILTPVYEAEFLGFSYGFRPERGQHDALDALAYGLGKRRINWVLDADIRSFFDTISHEWLIRFIEHRIGDRRIVRLIRKWLAAGVLEEGRTQDRNGGGDAARRGDHAPNAKGNLGRRSAISHLRAAQVQLAAFSDATGSSVGS